MQSRFFRSLKVADVWLRGSIKYYYKDAANCITINTHVMKHHYSTINPFQNNRSYVQDNQGI